MSDLVTRKAECLAALKMVYPDCASDDGETSTHGLMQDYMVEAETGPDCWLRVEWFDFLIEDFKHYVTRFNLKTLPSQYINGLKERFPNDAELITEYVQEAEHQDGDGYWEQFQSIEEVVEDFNLYKENLD